MSRLVLISLLYVYVESLKGFSQYRSSQQQFFGNSEKFNYMVERFSRYSNDDIMLLENDRLKHLVFGGREALNDTFVLKSFSILYEDILPVRFGGDILFNMIEKTLHNAKLKRSPSPKSNLYIPSENFKSVGPNQRKIISQIMSYALPEDMQRCDSLFEEIDSDKNGAISFEEFQAWVSSIEVVDVNGTSRDSILDTLDAENLFSEVDVNSDGKISFEEFKMWTTGLRSGEECDPYSSASIHDLPTPSPGSKKYRDRYLYMVQCFERWSKKFDDRGPSYTRMNLVIKGCFEGAKNPGVVKALGILYEDYLPLRIAGDVIFKLLESKIS